MEVTSKPAVEVAASSEICCEDEEEEVMLPGFRFHPTDEELVWFYLRRKVEKKPITIELIKQIDIYKYDPWDLPMSNVGDKEWYFFCIRGRKYRNSIRPNRVTVSGFWKATGVDKPIFSTLMKPAANQQDCIGLKKSLVYYRGSAGKGTKTDWMMHEFRLPFSTDSNSQDAEVWTLCRIFRRIPSHKKYTPTTTNSVKTHNPPSLAPQNPNPNCSISTSKPFQSHPFPTLTDNETKTEPSEQLLNNLFAQRNNNFVCPIFTPRASSEPSSPSSFWNDVNGGRDDAIFTDGGLDELRLVVQFAIDPSSHLYGC